MLGGAVWKAYGISFFVRMQIGSFYENIHDTIWIAVRFYGQ